MAEEKAAEEKGGGGKKTLFIIVGGVILMAAVAAGAYFAGSKLNGSDSPEKVVSKSTDKGEPAKAQDELGPLVPLDDIIVNILDDQGSRYLKASITLEMSNQVVVDEIQRRQPQIRDAVLLLMGSKSFDEIRDLQGKLQLRAEVIARVNEFLHDGKVVNLYFTDFVVQ